MKIIPSQISPIYNQGNNKETIFYSEEDYLEFLKLFRKYVYTHCKVLAYCLMPNHFHFLIYVSEDSAKIIRIGNIDSVELSNGFRLLQSNHARYMNQKTNRSGSLFRQKAKAKAMVDGDENYQFTAFHYIHQNPYGSGLVKRLEDWPFSSFLDFAGLRNGTLCDRVLVERLIDFDKHNFIEEAYKPINDALLYNIFDRRDRLPPSVGTEGQTDGGS